MTGTTWDPSTNDGMILSDNNFTATDPGNNGIVSIQATTAVHPGQKVFMEFTVPQGGATGSALSVGLDTKPFVYEPGVGDPGPPATAGLGNHNVNPPPTSGNSVLTGYDGSIRVGGNYLIEPHRGVNQYIPGGYVDIAIDTINNLFWERDNSTSLWNNDPNADPAKGTGGTDIHVLAGKTLYPTELGWTVGGHGATINGGANGFRGTIPTGFTPLDSLGGSSGGSSSGPGVGTGTGTGLANPIVVNQPTTLVAGNQTITGKESDPTQPVFLDWKTYGTPSMSDKDVVQATVAADGSFSATVNIDHAGTPSTIYAGTGGAFTAQWSATPMAFVPPSGTPSGSPGSSGSSAGDVVTVAQPASLVAGIQTITGVESDPTQAVFLNWHSIGTPDLSAPDWVKALVDPTTGAFSATMNIDHPGVASTMFMHTGTGVISALWLATPV